VSGLSTLVAYEFRFPQSPTDDNQWFLAPGVGYEHLTSQSTDPTVPSQTSGAIVPRVRFGYRHMLGHSMALDVSADVGVTEFLYYSRSSLTLPDETLSVLLAANIAVVWGL
jgi:hypothetical protein